METHRIEGLIYHDRAAIKEAHPSLFKGCKTAAAFLKRHSIPKDSYVHARLEKGSEDDWEISDGSSKRFDKLFIRRKFFREHLAPTTYPELPEQIELDDDACFQDEDGNVLAIDVRGERNHDEILFSGVDIGIAFDMFNLVKTIRNKTSRYEENLHFRKFVSPTAKSRTVTYLTYRGLMRVIFASYHGPIKSLEEKMSSMAFVSQFGTPTERQELAAQLVGVPPEVIKQVCRATSDKISCVYLYRIATVGEMREVMEIVGCDDSELVCKWGYTNSLQRRTSDHVGTYGKIAGANLTLLHWVGVDNRYTGQAEKDVRAMFAEMGCLFTYASYRELAIVSSSELKDAKLGYGRIGKEYSSKVDEMATKHASDYQEHRVTIVEKDARISALEHQVATAEKDAKISVLERQVSKLQYQARIRELEQQLADKSNSEQ